ncbi:ExeA family protein [Colwelliaceae bacterium 6471]
MSDRHKEALAHLTYGLGETGGFVLLTGEVGTGKTTISRRLLEQLPENSQAAFILNPTLSSQELLATICDELKIRYRKTGATLKTLTDKIQAKLLKNHEQDISTILIIDEAQHLRAEVLEQLRLLTNLETHTKKLLQVILIGQPELQQLLQRQDLRQLAQRITARYHLMPLNKREVEQYIQHRLLVADCNRAIFSANAINAIHQLSKGIPRLINLLCDRALLGAYGSNKQVVDRKLVMGASKEALGIEYQPKAWWQSSGVKAAMASVMLLMTIASGYLVGKNLSIAQTTGKSQPVQQSNDISASLINQSRSLGGSVHELFKLWRIVLDEEVVEPCQLAQSYDLACYWHKGNLSSLLKLGYPSVFKFNDLQGEAFYGLLTSVNRDELTFNFAGEIQQVDARWLDKYWQGGALVFWQAPVMQGQFFETIAADSDVVLLQWLEEKLSIRQNRPQRTVNRLDATLLNQLQQFQRLHGMSPAEVADRKALMMLANTVSQGLPIYSNQRTEDNG